MMRPVLVLWDAEQDVAEIVRWYDEQGAGLGKDFLADLARIVARLSRWPESGSHVGLRTRRALLARFPYLILYVLREDRIEITAVCHLARHPRRWSDRVQEAALEYAVV